jgi:dephospho-CoA kinase
MPAKDVIDLQLGVSSPGDAEELARSLAAAGFPAVEVRSQDSPHPAGADPAGWRKRFHANADPGRSVNLHVRVKDGPGWRWALLFRDWLTVDRSAADEYHTMKLAMAAEFASDGTAERYAQAKEPWFERVHERAERWAAATGWAPAETGTVGPPA